MTSWACFRFVVGAIEIDSVGPTARLPRASSGSSGGSSWRHSKMTLPIVKSEMAQRIKPASISRLMRIALEHPGVVSLAAGFVDQASLPVAMVGRAVDELLGDPLDGPRALQYGTTIGDAGFRERLADQMEREGGLPGGGVARTAGRTIVTTGSAQLIYLLCEAILDPGDIVLVESPTYFVFLGPVESRGARAIGVPVDEGGLNLDALEETLGTLERGGELGRVKLIYTIPEHSNPTGLCLAGERRPRLLEIARRWSRRQRILILEDAAYRGLSFGGQEPPTIFSQDDEGDWVIHARTFSKTLAPGIKLGYGVLPHELVEPIAGLKANHDFGTANFNQLVVDRILASGDYDRHVAGLRSIYKRKRDRFLSALDEFVGPLDPEIRWTIPEGGLFVWMTLPPGVDAGFEGPLFGRCVQEGVIYVPGEFAFADEPGPRPRNHLRLTYGLPGENNLVEGARRLGQALCGCLDPVA